MNLGTAQPPRPRPRPQGLRSRGDSRWDPAGRYLPEMCRVEENSRGCFWETAVGDSSPELGVVPGQGERAPSSPGCVAGRGGGRVLRIAAGSSGLRFQTRNAGPQAREKALPREPGPPAVCASHPGAPSEAKLRVPGALVPMGLTRASLRLCSGFFPKHPRVLHGGRGGAEGLRSHKTGACTRSVFLSRSTSSHWHTGKQESSGRLRGSEGRVSHF